MRQYRDGAAFCRAVIDRVGMDGLNRVWTSPETLPTRDEIADPQLWLARMTPPRVRSQLTVRTPSSAVARRALGPATLTVVRPSRRP